MKKNDLIYILLLITSSAFSQIKTANNIEIKKPVDIIKYDSLKNYICPTDAAQYVGQTLYYPNTPNEYNIALRGFNKDMKGHVYKPIRKDGNTKYEAVAGKYFDVISVVKTPCKKWSYINDTYLLLKEKETGEELYFELCGEEQFPFIIEGYFKKSSGFYLNKNFYTTEIKKKYIELFTDNKGIVWGDSIYYGDYLKLKCIDHIIDESAYKYKDLFVFVLSNKQTIRIEKRELNATFLLNEKDLEPAKDAWKKKMWEMNKLINEKAEKDSLKTKILAKAIKKYKNKKIYNLYEMSLGKLSEHIIDSIYYNTISYKDDNVIIGLIGMKGEHNEIESDILEKDGSLISVENYFIKIPPRKKYPKVRYWELIQKQKVRIGMTKTEALLSWGEPDDINKSSGTWGNHEQWVYPSSYLYFENGILTSIQN